MKRGRQSKNVEDRRNEITIIDEQVTPGDWVTKERKTTETQKRDALNSEHLRDKKPLAKQEKTILDRALDLVNTNKHPYSDLNVMKNLKETAKPQKLKK